MKKNLIAAVLAAAVLAGCAFPQHPHGPFRYLDPVRPAVDVVGGRFVVVSPEPLVFLKDQRDVLITWQLPPDGKLRFPRDGIVIEQGGEEFVNCGPRNDGLAFSCLNRHSKPGKYRYTIRVLVGEKRIESDPTIMNE